MWVDQATPRQPHPRGTPGAAASSYLTLDRPPAAGLTHPSSRSPSPTTPRDLSNQPQPQLTPPADRPTSGTERPPQATPAAGQLNPRLDRTPHHQTGRHLLELYAIGKDISKLLEVCEEGRPTRTTAAHPIRGGKAELLVGLPERPWLDAKSQLYDASNEGGRISIAHL